MEKLTIKFVNAQTGEELEREMNEEEISQYNADNLFNDEQRAREAVKLAAKAELLAKLGITAEEAAILLS